MFRVSFLSGEDPLLTTQLETLGAGAMAKDDNSPPVQSKENFRSNCFLLVLSKYDLSTCKTGGPGTLKTLPSTYQVDQSGLDLALDGQRLRLGSRLPSAQIGFSRSSRL